MMRKVRLWVHWGTSVIYLIWHLFILDSEKMFCLFNIDSSPFASNRTQPSFLGAGRRSLNFPLSHFWRWASLPPDIFLPIASGDHRGYGNLQLAAMHEKKPLQLYCASNAWMPLDTERISLLLYCQVTQVLTFISCCCCLSSLVRLIHLCLPEFLTRSSERYVHCTGWQRVLCCRLGIFRFG